jgi:hypothetical protein
LKKELQGEIVDEALPSLLELIKNGKLGEARVALNRLETHEALFTETHLQLLRKALCDAHASTKISIEHYLAFKLPNASGSLSPCVFK